MGVLALVAYRWINAPVKSDSFRHFRLSYESIPEGADESLMEAAVEEIISENGRYADELADPEYMEENRVYALEAADPEKVTFTFAGDILFDPNYSVMSTLRQNGGSIDRGIAPEVINIMRNSDIMMINNEFPYSGRGTPLEGKQFTFRADPSDAAYLNDLGVDLVSLANNHAYDYGMQALVDTFDAIDSAGVEYVGAGMNDKEACKPIYYIVNNQKIAVLSATQIEKGDSPDTRGAGTDTPGVFRCWKPDALLEQIRTAKENSDFVIVYIHWGTESQVETDWAQDEQAPMIAEAGADLIIGDHPHILQRLGTVRGTPIIYSLGNFWFNSKTQDTCLVQVDIGQGGMAAFRFIPCVQSGCRTDLLHGEEKARVLQYMRSISPGVSIDEEGYVTFN